MANKFAGVGLILAVVLPVALLVYLRFQSQSAPDGLSALPTPAIEARPALPVPPQAEPSPTPPDGYGAHAVLQARLDALADAYNDGNIKSIELALWPNHAVVRPNGETLDREGVLRNWQSEWEDFAKRELKLKILSFEQSGEFIDASWTVDLVADIHGDEGQMHKFEFHGVQEARYQVQDGQELLVSPLTYSGYEQTMDGEPWGGSN